MNNKISVLKYNPVDIEVNGLCNKNNPFYAELKGEFRGPEEETISIPGFYDGNGTWKVRFSPTKEGVWKYNIASEDIFFDEIYGEIECIENNNDKIHGRIRINRENPYHFINEDGTNHFMMAYECDWLWALDLGNSTGNRTQEFIDSIKTYKFNNIIVNIYAYDTTWAHGKTCKEDYGPPSIYAWEGTNDNPDHSRINTLFFKYYDRMMTCLLNEGITAHILLKVYNKDVNWPKKYSLEDDLYFKYIISRYQAFPNIIWDYSKEAYYETDKEYINYRIDFIRAYDSYKHLITLHDDRIFYFANKYNRNLDFFTAQQHDDFYHSVINERNKKKWPIFNSEFGYEWGPCKKALTWTAQSAEEFVRRGYEVVMGGGYPCYYYDYTAWDIIDYTITPPGYNYFSIMYEFFTAINWWKLEPHPELCCWHGRCLAKPEKEYIFFIDADKNALFSFKINKKYKATWTNIYTGKKVIGKLYLDDWVRDMSSELIMSKNPFAAAPALLHIIIEE